MRIRKPDPAGTRAGCLRLAAQRPVEAKDLLRIRDVSDPQLSPDGAWVAYTVSARRTRWRTRATPTSGWRAGTASSSVRLTSSTAKESRAALEPRRTLSRLPLRPATTRARWGRSGCSTGRAARRERVTDLPGGVSDFAWSPDGTRLALIACDPDARAARRRAGLLEEAPPADRDRPLPVQGGRGRLYRQPSGITSTSSTSRTARRRCSRRRVRRGGAVLVARRAVDRVREPAAAGVRPHRQLGPLRRRRASPGAEPRQLTTFEGADSDPEWGSRRAGWSPDGKLIAYVQGGPLELLYYGGQKVAVVPVGRRPGPGAHGGARPQRPVARLLARRRVGALPAGGRPGLPPRPGARGRRQRRADGRGQAGARGLLRRVVTAGSRVASSTPDAPDRGLRGRGARAPARSPRQNDAWLAQVRLAPVEEISVQEPGRHRDPRLHGQAAGLSARARRYPTILRIHGGPVWQFYHDFANLDWQVLAAQGYVVLGVNPRGSSGRGEKFSTAIWADWGEKDGEDVLAAVDYAVAAGHRRSRAAGRRRLELRRDPHQPGDRARPAVQGGDQRRGAGERARWATAPTSTRWSTSWSWASRGPARTRGGGCR